MNIFQYMYFCIFLSRKCNLDIFVLQLMDKGLLHLQLHDGCENNENVKDHKMKWTDKKAKLNNMFGDLWHLCSAILSLWKLILILREVQILLYKTNKILFA